MVALFTTRGYRVAEFNQRSGNLNWHRVVPALHEAVIENWFSSRIPQALALKATHEPEPAIAANELIPAPKPDLRCCSLVVIDRVSPVGVSALSP